MPKILDLTGQNFGRLSVTARLGSHCFNGRFKVMWQCACVCGNIVEVASNNLRTGHTRSCGCLCKDTAAKIAMEHPLPRNNRDISGMSFNYLTAISPTPRRTRGSVVWQCACRCGRQHAVALRYLISGEVKSCGCIRGESSVTHGATRGGEWTPEYIAWAGMMRRCYNQKAPRFKDYGARGIRVCERWHSFEDFLSDMGQKPHRLTLERVENDKDYEPANCEWATYRKQNRNRRNNHLLTWRSETKCIAAWADCTGLRAQCISSRLSRGWKVERALSTPTS